MKFLSMHPNFKLPTKGTENAAAFDIYMPEAGEANGTSKLIGLGFATAIPNGFVGLLLPRSSMAKYGLELNNTVGVIDSDYRGEWKAAVKTKTGIPHSWVMHERLFQMLVLPHYIMTPILVESLEETSRQGGFGSTGT